MTCSEVREYVFAFLDNELDAPLSMELQRHLDRCHDCAREVEIERAIAQELAHQLESGSAEPALAVDTIRSLVGRDNRPPLPTPRSRRWLLAACIPALILAGASIYATWRSRSGEVTSRFVQLVTDDFTHFLEKGAVVQIASSDPHMVAAWLHDKTGVHAIIPSFGDSSWSLIGGRKCKIDNRPAPFAVYKRGDTLASLVAVPTRGTSLSGMEVDERLGTAFWVGERNGLSVVAIHQQDLIYAAVAECAKDDLVKLMSGVINEGN